MLPLVAIFGATASGKTALSLALAQRFGGEALSCDSVAVYRRMELGTAKPSAAERALVRHHLLDLYDPDEVCTAGDYARHARAALAELAARKTLPIVVGGTGLYLRALLDGLFAAPPRDEALRELLRARAVQRGTAHLHGTLFRFDPVAAQKIHANDVPKVIRAIEVSLAARRPMTEQWTEGRDALTGYSVLRLGLDPPRAELYARINARAAAMFREGLVEETRTLRAEFGAACRPLTSLGYAQAAAVLDGAMTETEAIAAAQQGHRNYAKRQMTWFRREAELHPVQWLRGVGDSAEVIAAAIALVERHLETTVGVALRDRQPA
jgi:tRNA dimethylallyltransferase